MNRREVADATKAFLKEQTPGAYWRERRKLHRKLDKHQQLERLKTRAAAIPAKAEKPGFVYVIGCAGHPVKIGVAVNVERRLAGIQTGFPHPLRIYFTIEVDDARKVERLAHTSLSTKRLNGEWFDCEPAEAIEVIQRVAQPFAA